MTSTKRLRNAVALLGQVLDDCAAELPLTPDNYRVVLAPLKDARQQILDEITRLTKEAASR